MNSLKGEGKQKILLDTTYLLPILGVEVKGTRETIQRLKILYEKGDVELYFSPFSVLEAMGKISKNSYDEARLESGLISLFESDVFKGVLPTRKGYMEALKLRVKGFKDLIDLMLYSTSITRKLKFLTEDENLKYFIKKVKEDQTVFLNREELWRSG